MAFSVTKLELWEQAFKGSATSATFEYLMEGTDLHPAAINEWLRDPVATLPAGGVEWPDGSVSMRWLGNTPSFVSYDGVSPKDLAQRNGLKHMEVVHGHKGKTITNWKKTCQAAFSPTPTGEHLVTEKPEE